MAFCVYVWGVAVVDDFVFGLFDNILCFLLLSVLTDRYLPFSRQPSTQATTGRLVRTILQFVLIGLLVALHYVLTNHAWIMYALLPLVIGACVLLTRGLQRTPWNKIAI